MKKKRKKEIGIFGGFFVQKNLQFPFYNKNYKIKMSADTILRK